MKFLLCLITVCLLSVHLVLCQEADSEETTEPTVASDAPDSNYSGDPLDNNDVTEDTQEPAQDDSQTESQEGLKSPATKAQQEEPQQQPEEHSQETVPQEHTQETEPEQQPQQDVPEQQTQDTASSDEKKSEEPRQHQQQPQDTNKPNNEGKVKVMNAWNYLAQFNPPTMNPSAVMSPLPLPPPPQSHYGYSTFVQHMRHDPLNFVYQNPIHLQTLDQPNTQLFYSSYSPLPSPNQPFVYYYPQYLQHSAPLPLPPQAPQPPQLPQAPIMPTTIQHTVSYAPAVNTMASSGNSRSSPAVVTATAIKSHSQQPNQQSSNWQTPSVFAFGSAQGTVKEPSKANTKGGLFSNQNNRLSPGNLIKQRY